MTELKHQLVEAAETATKAGDAVSEALLVSEYLLAEKVEHARIVGAENISKAGHASAEAVLKGEKTLAEMAQRG